MVVNWVLESCSNISENLIKKSFKNCGINLDQCGAENNTLNSKLLLKAEIKSLLILKFSKKTAINENVGVQLKLKGFKRENKLNNPNQPKTFFLKKTLITF